MTKPSITQSQKRFNESMGPLFMSSGMEKELLLLKSSSDVGVMRNAGRNGAKHAPQSFLSFFKKLTQDQITKSFALIEKEVASSDEEIRDFESSQTKQSERIEQSLKSHPKARICHLGGGHDHIYPLLCALSQNKKHVVVINIDAHADTRTDDKAHSGTPFRQFAEHFTGQFDLYQVGLHPFANSLSTLTPLAKGKMSILWRSELSKMNEFFAVIKSTITKDTLVVFSIDADGLDGSAIPGVSAVNPWGLSMEELMDLWKQYLGLNFSHAPIMGLYELNPVYDSLSMLSMRRMAAFVYETLRI